jgi:hypothetical protein
MARNKPTIPITHFPLKRNTQPILRSPTIFSKGHEFKQHTYQGKVEAAVDDTPRGLKK